MSLSGSKDLPLLLPRHLNFLARNESHYRRHQFLSFFLFYFHSARNICASFELLLEESARWLAIDFPFYNKGTRDGCCNLTPLPKWLLIKLYH